MTRPLEVTASSATRVTELVKNPGANAPVQLLKVGAKGGAVERLQQSLRRVGLPLEKVTGLFDAKTVQAIKTFQKANALPVTGAYDAKTRAALSGKLEVAMAQQGPTLTVGTRGVAVKALENKLAKAGLLSGKADGFYDAATRAAVMKFEKQQGLKVDGIANASVWKALGGAGEGSGRTLKKAGEKGLTVVALQQRLKELGLYAGKAHGTYDAATVRAVKAFEKKQGLTVDGVVDARAWDELGTHVVVKERLGGPKLKLGQSGTAVRILENKLKAKGILKGKVDGKFDAETKRAVAAFERRNGWKADGVAGNQVWLALGGAGEGSGPGLKLGSKNAPAVKVLQQRLKTLGFYDGAVDGSFDKQTAAAVKRLETRHGISKPDGVVSTATWRALQRHVVNNPVPKPVDAKEPAHNYRRVKVDEGWINVRTREMLKRAESYASAMGVKNPHFYMVQGSYSSSVSASGGTHDGGGAIDLRTWQHTKTDVVKMVKALRMAGFAAWKRGFGGDNFDPHIHAIAIGDRQLSSGARSQVAEYFRGGDGLIGSAPDGDRGVGKPFPNWAKKYR